MLRRNINQIVVREALERRRSRSGLPRSKSGLLRADRSQRLVAAQERSAPSFDAAQATLLGQYVEAAYTIFGDNPGSLLPSASTNFPSEYRLLPAVQMDDFIIGTSVLRVSATDCHGRSPRPSRQPAAPASSGRDLGRARTCGGDKQGFFVAGTPPIVACPPLLVSRRLRDCLQRSGAWSCKRSSRRQPQQRQYRRR